MDLLKIMQNRRSVRNYTEEPVLEEKLDRILQAGLLSASSRSIRPWELIVIQDKEMLKRMAECRTGAAKMLKHAAAAVVVVGNEDLSDVWIEDCAIVMANMHLMADSLGVGSCWIQGRLRETPSGKSTEEYLRAFLAFPQAYRLAAILSLGMPEQHAAKHELSEIAMEKIHYEKF